MKNNEIIKSLDSILPSDAQKKIIYVNIFRHKKNYLLKYFFVLATACFCLLLYPGKTINNRAVLTRSFNVFYNDTCYEEYREYTGSKKNLVLIKDDLLFDSQAYKIKKSKNIVIYSDRYMEYRQCGGEIK